jgi:hypothetical protein
MLKFIKYLSNIKILASSANNTGLAKSDIVSGKSLTYNKNRSAPSIEP